MLDMAFCIAAGIEWHGHDVKCGPVVIVEAEGTGSLKDRQNAWLAGHPEVDRTKFEENINYHTRAIQITNTAEIAALKNGIALLPEQPILIVIDTLARCFVGHDENSAKDMGLFNDAEPNSKTRPEQP